MREEANIQFHQCWGPLESMNKFVIANISHQLSNHEATIQ